jgi:putative spermidine/putrescine transport system permease protein
MSSVKGKGVWLTSFNVVVTVIMLAPMILVMLTSFTPSAYYEIPTMHWSLQWYREISRVGFLDGLVVSLGLALLAALCSLILGFLAAFVMTRYVFKGKVAIDAIFMAPIVVPAVALGVALLQFFVNVRMYNTFYALLVAHVVITVPYIIRTAAVSLAAVSRDMEMAAMDLGASSRQSFMYVTMPLIRSGLISGYIFAFLISFGEVAMTIFVIGSKYTTLPVKMFNYMLQVNTPVIAAMSTVLIGFSVLLMVVLDRLFGLRTIVG